MRVTDLVQTEGYLAFVRKGMNEMCSNMLSRKRMVGPAGKMVSLPEVDRGRKDKRTKPMGSQKKG